MSNIQYTKVSKIEHTRIFVWYFWALDEETQRVLRPMMEIMIDPDCDAEDRYDAYMFLDVNITHLVRNRILNYEMPINS